MGQGQSTTAYHPSAVGPQDQARANSSHSVKSDPPQEVWAARRDYAGRIARAPPLRTVPGQFVSPSSSPYAQRGSPAQELDAFGYSSGRVEERAGPWLLRQPRAEPQSQVDSGHRPPSSDQDAWGGWRPTRDRTVSLSALSATSQAGSGATFPATDTGEQATAALRAIHRIPEMPEESTDSEVEEATNESSGPAPTPRRLSVPLAEALRMGLGRFASGSSQIDLQSGSIAGQPPPTQSRPSSRTTSAKRETGETDRERLLAFWAREDARQISDVADDRSAKRRRRHSWSSSAADGSADDPSILRHEQSGAPYIAPEARVTQPVAPSEALEMYEDPYEAAPLDNFRRTSLYETPMQESDDSPYPGVTDKFPSPPGGMTTQALDSSVRSDRDEDPARHLLAAQGQLNPVWSASNQTLQSAARPSSSFEASVMGVSIVPRHRVGGPDFDTQPLSAGIDLPESMATEAVAQPLQTTRVADPQFTSSSSDFEDSDGSHDQLRRASDVDAALTSGAESVSRQHYQYQHQHPISPAPVYVSQLDSVMLPSPQSRVTTSEEIARMGNTSSSEAHSTRASVGSRPATQHRLSADTPKLIPNGLVGVAPAGPVANLRAQRHMSNVTGVSSQGSHAYSSSQTSEADAARRAEIEILRAGPSYRRDEEASELFSSRDMRPSPSNITGVSTTGIATESIGRSRASSLFSKLKTRMRKGSDVLLSSPGTFSRDSSRIMSPGLSREIDPALADSNLGGVSSYSSQPSGLIPNRSRQVSAPPAMYQSLSAGSRGETSTTSARLTPRDEVSSFTGSNLGTKSKAPVRRKPVQYPVATLRKPPSISGSLRSSRSARSARSMRSMKSTGSFQASKHMLERSPQHQPGRLLAVQDQEDDGGRPPAMEVLTIGSWLKSDTSGSIADGRRSSRGSGTSRSDIRQVPSSSSTRLGRTNLIPQGREPGWEDIEEELVDDPTLAQSSADATTIIKSSTMPDSSLSASGPREEKQRRKKGLGAVLGWPRRASKPQDSDASDEGMYARVTPFITPTSAVHLPSPMEPPSYAAQALPNARTAVEQPERRPSQTQHKLLDPTDLQSVPISKSASHSSSFSSLAPPPAPQPLPPKRPRRARNRRTASDSQTGSQSEGGGNAPSPQSSKPPLHELQSQASRFPAAPVWDESLLIAESEEMPRRDVSSPHGTLATIQSSHYMRGDDDAASRILSEDRGVPLSERGPNDVDTKSMRSPFGKHAPLQKYDESQVPAGSTSWPSRHAVHHSMSSIGAVIADDRETIQPAGRGTSSLPQSSGRGALFVPPLNAHARAASNSLTSDDARGPHSPSAQSGLSMFPRHPAGSSTASFVKHPGEDELRSRVRVPSQAESDLSTASAKGVLSSAAAVHASTAHPSSTVLRRGAVHRRVASASAATDHLSAALNADEMRHASRALADPQLIKPRQESTQSHPAAEEPVQTPRRPLPTPPISPTDTTVVASPAYKDIDGLPTSAASPTFKSLALNRASWQSSDGPWKAELIHVTSPRGVKGYATPSKSKLRLESVPRRSSASGPPHLRERSSSEPLTPTFTGRAQSPVQDALLPKGGVQASLAALKALESSAAESSGEGPHTRSALGQSTVSRFLGSTKYQLPPRKSRLRKLRSSEDETSVASSVSKRRRSRRHASRYYSTEEGLSSASSRAAHREARRRRRERSRYQGGSQYDERADLRPSYVRQAAVVLADSRDYRSRYQRQRGSDRGHRHNRHRTDMAVVSDAGLLDTDFTYPSGTQTDSDWVEYVPHRDQHRQRAHGGAPRFVIPVTAEKRSSDRRKPTRSDRQYASEILVPLRGAQGLEYRRWDSRRPRGQDVEAVPAGYLHYITPPRRSARVAAAALQSGHHQHHDHHHEHQRGERDLPFARSTITADEVDLDDDDESMTQGGHDRYRTAATRGASQADWDETIVPAVRRQIEVEREEEERMKRESRQAPQATPTLVARTANGALTASTDVALTQSQDSIQFPSKSRRSERQRDHVSERRDDRLEYQQRDKGTYGTSRATRRGHGPAAQEQRSQHRTSRHMRDDEQEDIDSSAPVRQEPARRPRRGTKTSASTSASRPRHSKRGLEKEDILIWQQASAFAATAEERANGVVANSTI